MPAAGLVVFGTKVSMALSTPQIGSNSLIPLLRKSGQHFLDASVADGGRFVYYSMLGIFSSF